MRTFLICLAVAVFAIPATALAAKPPHPSHPAHPPHPNAPAPTTKTHNVTYVLKGSLSTYTGTAVTIVVAHSNHHGKALNGATLTFTLNSSTKVVLGHRTTITDKDRGVIKVRAPKNTDAATIQTLVPSMVIDQGSAH
jgi:hypothetical protein